MAKRVQILGHATAAANVFEGLGREVTVETTKNTLRVHDGLLPGGYELARADVSNVQVATNAQPGAASAAHIAELEALRADLTAEIAATDADFVTVNADIAAVDAKADGKASLISGGAAGNLVVQTAGGDIIDGDIPPLHLANTRIPFVMSAPPTGWKVYTGFDGRALFIKGTFNGVAKGGGATGGTDDPGLMNKVPSHTHGAGSYSAASAGAHTHRLYQEGGAGTGVGIEHTNDPTKVWSNNYVESDGAHTHSITGTSAANGSAANWTPKYATTVIGEPDV